MRLINQYSGLPVIRLNNKYQFFNCARLNEDGTALIYLVEDENDRFKLVAVPESQCSLTLRPISDLTDEECYNIAGLSGIEDYLSWLINRKEDKIVMRDPNDEYMGFVIYENGRLINMLSYLDDTNSVICSSPPFFASYQYMLQQCIALPFLLHTTKDLVESGIIDLKLRLIDIIQC